VERIERARPIGRAQLEATGKLRPAGKAAITEARKSGAWDAPARPKAPAKPPAELDAALACSAGARTRYDALTPSQRRAFHGWIADAKRPSTRERRADRAVDMLLRGSKRPDA